MFQNLYDCLEALAKDNCKITFSSYDELEDFLNGLENTASWHTIPCQLLHVDSAQEVSTDMVSATAIRDTIDNGTGLALVTTVGTFPIGQTAMVTLRSRMRIAGNGLSDLSVDGAKVVYNTMLGVAKGKALLRVVGDKVIACHGGDAKDYSIIPQNEVFENAQIYLFSAFGGKFVGATYDHYLTSAVWEISNGEILKVYEEMMQKNGREVRGSLNLHVEVITSDVGWSGANIRYQVKEGDHYVALHSKRVCNHKGKTISDFRDNLNTLLSGYRESLQNMEKLADIHLTYYQDAIYNMAKKAKLPKRMVDDAIERSGRTFGTAFDAYLDLCYIMDIAQEQHIIGRPLNDLEEALSSCVMMNWRKMDYKK